MRRRILTESRMESASRYEAKSHWSQGLTVHSQAGHSTPTRELLLCLGGMLMMRFRSCPSEIAWRCSAIADT
jgi:hypothetical protein